MVFSSKTMNLRINNAVAYLTFKKLENYRFINHAFSTRLGGVSKGQFSSMNLSFKRGDCIEDVMQNYSVFCAASGFDCNSLVIPSLTHSNNVGKASRHNRGSGVIRASDFADIDALITNETDVTLVTPHADCTPIFIVDPIKKAVGIVHSGWRGTSKKIAGKAVNRLILEFGCRPDDMICCLGPCICKCCFEVKDDVRLEFKKMSLIREDKVILNKNGKIYLDLLEANKQILLDNGVKEENIILSDICTMCSKDLLFSYRSMGEKSGVMLAMIRISNY